jgi:hypothetical protein
MAIAIAKLVNTFQAANDRAEGLILEMTAPDVRSPIEKNTNETEPVIIAAVELETLY